MEELERIFCCLGMNPPTEDMADLLLDMDPKTTGKLNYNDFIVPMISYIQKGYDKYQHGKAHLYLHILLVFTSYRLPTPLDHHSTF